MRHEEDVTGAIKCRMIGGELLCEPATYRNMLHADIYTVFPSVPEGVRRIGAGETVYLSSASIGELEAALRAAGAL